jgi:hypothetical protein
MTPAVAFQVQLPDWMKGVTPEQIRLRVLSPGAAPTVSLSAVSAGRVQISLGSFQYYASVVLEAPNRAADWKRYQ